MNRKERDIIFKQHMHIVPTLVNKMLRNPSPRLQADRDDIIQQGYIRLVQLIDKEIELHSASFGTYAYTSMSRHIARLIKQTKSKHAEMTGWEEDVAEGIPDNSTLSSEKIQSIRDAIGGLTQEERLAYQLHYVVCLPLKDSARILGMRYVNAVKLLGRVHEKVIDVLRN